MQIHAQIHLLCGILLAIASVEAFPFFRNKLNPVSIVKNISIDPKMTRPKWHGWGTSLAWSMNVFGQRQDLADALFTTKDQVEIDSGKYTLPGLGLNIVRYNFGGSGDKVTVRDGKEIRLKKSRFIPPFKEMQTYWQDGLNEDPTSSSWNWTVDANQRAMLLAAKVRGANIFEAFVNSPPWWMTESLTASGGGLFSWDQLLPRYRGQFAMYMATIVKYAKDNWGIDFTYMEPFNEPTGFWWVYPIWQEGKRISVPGQVEIINHLRDELDKRGLQETGIAILDENSPQVTLDQLKKLVQEDRSIVTKVAKVNTHGYVLLFPYRGPARAPLREETSKYNLKLWNSEHGDWNRPGMTLFEGLGLDYNDMQVNGWCYWLAVDNGDWGLIDVTYQNQKINTVNTKYFVLAHFTRHIRQGMFPLNNSDKKTVAAYDSERKVLVIVSGNLEEQTAEVKYDLSKFTSVQGPIYRWTTDSSTLIGESNSHLYVKLDLELNDSSISNGTLSLELPSKWVHTLEIHGVEL